MLKSITSAQWAWTWRYTPVTLAFLDEDQFKVILGLKDSLGYNDHILKQTTTKSWMEEILKWLIKSIYADIAKFKELGTYGPKHFR